MPDLLIELFSEEIPSGMQSRAAEDLRRLMTDGMVEAGLTYAAAQAFSTPRRLALAIEGLTPDSPTIREERKGPRTDAPEKALEGFLRSTGLARDQLEARDTGKGEVWFATIEKPGRPAAVIVAEVLEATIRNFPWPKSMRWGDGSLRWVRPLHSILCVLSENGEASVVPLELDGLQAGDTTEGHRFMGAARFAVTSFEDYAAKLKRAHVMLSTEERAEKIWHDATQEAFAQGLEVVEDKGLLAEVAGLVEWPVVLMGAIGEAFLDLPPEVLRTSMKEHQKFFSVKDKSGRIIKFVTVANRETADGGATILAGNQKVLSARLSDAKFFWENDLRVAKAGMGVWLDALKSVTFHGKLGSQAERIERIAALAREIAPVVGADADDAEKAARVAKADLSSAMVYEFPELQGTMGEYYARAAGLADDVAAVAREHYAPLGPSDDVPSAPLSVAVALADKIDTLTGFWAIDEKPTGSKDPFALRRAALGVIRLVLENGVHLHQHGFLAASIKKLWHSYDYGKVVYGADDLFGHANGTRGGDTMPATYWHTPIFKDLLDSSGLGAEFESFTRYSELAPKFRVKEIGNDHPKELVDLRKRIQDFYDMMLYWKLSNADETEETKKEWADNSARADEYFQNRATKVAIDLLAFLHDRLKGYLRDRGIRHDVIDACLAMPNADDLTLLVKRAEALSEFLTSDDGGNLIQGFKRAHNILKQAEEKDGVEYSFGPDPKLAKTDDEKALFAALDAAEAKIAPAMQAEDFGAAMQAMATLRTPIDAFFESVQVNAESQILRRNRLNLLHRISATCLSVADLTRLDG